QRLERLREMVGQLEPQTMRLGTFFFCSILKEEISKRLQTLDRVEKSREAGPPLIQVLQGCEKLGDEGCNWTALAKLGFRAKDTEKIIEVEGVINQRLELLQEKNLTEEIAKWKGELIDYLRDINSLTSDKEANKQVALALFQEIRSRC